MNSRLIGSKWSCFACMLSIIAARSFADTHYVDINCITPTPPYTNWTTAATVIQDAVDVASEGDLVLVTNGIYAAGGRRSNSTITNRVAICKAMQVRSVNGPDTTLIVGNGPCGSNAVRCAYVTNNAVLAGFTLTNGATLTSGDLYKDQCGGGVWCEPSGAVTNSILIGNSARNHGGAAYQGFLNNCALSGNSCSNYGGGAYNGTLNTCTLTGNSALYGGGGVYNGTLIRCTLSGNSCSNYGGGACDGTLNTCTLTGNSAASGGGASSGTLTNCTLTGNLASGNGGGVYGSTVSGCALYGNSAPRGGGASWCTLKNCTLVGNSALYGGGGVDCGTLFNCIVYFNTALANPNYVDGSLNYCCTTPQPSGTGNITNEPFLVSMTHVATDSPCVGKGSIAYVSGKDIDGETWRTPPSIGVDEPYAASATGGLSVAIGLVDASVYAGGQISFTALIEGRVTRSAWDFGDSSGVTNQAYASHAWGVPGSYSVVLTAWNVDHPLGVSCTTVVSVVAQPVCYVNALNQTPAYPYISWTTAATNIQDAIDAAGIGYLVLVTNGLYATGGRPSNATITNRVTIGKAIEVRSVNGPETTFIVGKGPCGPGAVRCAYVTNGAQLVGFTLTNGATLAWGDSTKELLGGGVWCEGGGVVSNCLLVGNSAANGGGGGYSGTLNHCAFIDNFANSFGGGVAQAILNNCKLSGNFANEGGGSYGGALDKCALFGNSSSSYGGGASRSTLKNCSLSFNSAISGGGASYGALNNCVLNDNSAIEGGGAYEGKLSNCALFGNSASSCGGGTSRGSLNNCTVSGNSASSGGGVYGGVSTNCIVYYNKAYLDPNFSLSTPSFCCTTPNPGGTGNITNEPCLVSPTHIAKGSPCVGRGIEACVTGTDLDGDIWRTPPSIGADEPCASSTLSEVSVSIGAVYTRVAIGFETSFTALIRGPVTSNVWDFGDGVTLTNQPYANHKWMVAGSYALVLNAWTSDYPSGLSYTTVVSVVSQPVSYVNVSNATPAYPYTCWEMAATNIQQAISVDSTAGRLVLVSNGVYEVGGVAVYGSTANSFMTNRVSLTSAVTVRSVNGPKFTFIKGRGPVGNGAVRCAYVGNDSVLEGFTLTNGATCASGDVAKLQSGGGVWCELGGAVSNCTLSGNSAFFGGGAYGGTLNACMLSKNSATDGGGASYVRLNTCTLSGNSATRYGGGANFGTLNNCTLSGNFASSDGGGTYYGILDNCMLSSNSASSYGGGTCYGALSNCTLTNNSAGGGGGAYYSALINCALSGNTAGMGGGAYNGTMINCSLNGNKASSYGGGAREVALTNCTLTGNSAQGGGGASGGALNRCMLMGNSAQSGGGADGSALNNCSLSDNRADAFGGGVCGGTLNNCVLSGNSAVTAGGGVYNATLNNCTVTGNSAGSGGGALGGYLNNCILFYNKASVGANYSQGPDRNMSLSINYCCTTPNPGGTGNITNEPCLVSTAHIAVGSPCVGRGSAVAVSGTDIDGDAWRSSPSIGADEPWSVAATGGLSVAISAVYTKLTVGFDAPFMALIEGRVTHSTWDFGDGSVLTNRPCVNHAWVVTGTYSVVLTAWNSDYLSGVAYTTLVSVVAQPVCYVNVSNAVPAYPYSSWETAATNIQQALNADSTAGRLVVVTNGVYEVGGQAMYGTMTNRVALTKAVTVRSVNGPNVTTIKGKSPWGNGAVRCAYVGVDCLLAGFTLTNGATGSGSELLMVHGGGVWCDIGGVVSNCLIVGNSATRGGGVSYGTLFDCLLSGNRSNDGGGAYYSTLNNCTLTGNTSTGYGGGASCATMNNCEIISNSVTSSSGFGGGVYNGRLRNCILLGNAAINDGGGVYHCTLYNSVLCANSSSRFGGGAGDSNLQNCTLTGNSASLGGGVYGSRLMNCLVYYNTAQANPNYGGGSLKYCCTTPDPGGTANIIDEPRLVSASHISADSPCVGKGTASYSVTEAVSGVDIDGDAWRTPPSMGADEPYATSSTGELTVAIGAIYSKVSAGFETSFTALIYGRVTQSAWDFGDGCTSINQPYANHTWNNCGTYVVKLTAWNTDYPSGVVCTTIVSVVEAPVRYVNVSNISSAYPYTNWAIAATTIQQAISAGSEAGRVVLVSNGIYEVGSTVIYGAMANRIALTNGVTVRSVNGPSVTVIKGMGPLGNTAVRCAYVGKGSILAGFTLTNGATRTSGDWLKETVGGGTWCETGGVVSNCLIVGSSAFNHGGGVYGGTISDCIVSYNKAGQGGGVYGGVLNRCVISCNSTANGNGGGVSQGMLNNCTLWGNSAKTYGGAAYYSTLNNCVLISNVVVSCGGGAAYCTLKSCTVVGNSALGQSGGGTHYGALDNCIVYYNTSPSGQNYYNGSLSYCCTIPSAAGVGNTAKAPVFRDPAKDDYRLSVLSPCINAGQNQAWMFTATDLDGKPRIRNGIVDMGAYEFVFNADLKGLLQGPYSTNTHKMVSLISTNLLARSPFAADARSVSVIPSNTVDWALVEVKDTNGISLASTSVFLDPQGRATDMSGSPTISLEVSAGSYYLALRHRNHLAAMSAQPVAFTNTVVSYDFTTGPDKYLGGTNACVKLEPGVWGLIGGDADGDGRITPVDREIVRRQQGMSGYLQGDLNLDGKVDGDDE